MNFAEAKKLEAEGRLMERIRPPLERNKPSLSPASEKSVAFVLQNSIRTGLLIPPTAESLRANGFFKSGQCFGGPAQAGSTDHTRRFRMTTPGQHLPNQLALLILSAP